jgi:hypothetical protein
MHATSYQDKQASASTLDVLEPYDAEECKSSEATWLPITWRSPQRWRPPLRHKTRAAALSGPPKNKLSAPPVNVESFLVFEQATEGDLDDSLDCGRVEKARNLLLNPHYDFSEIAAELGFESLGQFNQAFRKVVGESPNAYRARLPVGMWISVQGA